MESDALWQAFAETGDPICYLLYRAAEAFTIEEESSGPRP